MKISLNWLGDYIDLKGLTPDQIGFHLTDLGLEVEELILEKPLPASIVSGKILECHPHPSADSLSLCKVEIGQSEPLAIVCGAPNARQGIKVAVATVGTKMPGGLEIKSAKIRGEASSGMLCSEEELGLSEKSGGIWELPETSEIGIPIQSLLPPPDATFTLNITPNRGDCLSYIGVARELAARLGGRLKIPTLSYPTEKGIKTSDMVSLNITPNSGCSQFCALYVKDLVPGPSPLWFQKRLISAGLRPISNIVDVTNYVMMETGQPIHAYDARDIKGGILGVRGATRDEKIKVLDGSTLNLEESDILIVDNSGPIGLAGIMGGENSEVKDDTTAIIIESASFDAVQISKTARRLGLRTEASQRFERKTNPELIAFAAQRVADLLLRISQENVGGNQDTPAIAADVLSYNINSEAPLGPIKFRLSRLHKIYGASRINMRECQQILSSLGFQGLDDGDAEEIDIIPPPWRHDVEKEIDLIEELIRHHGYEHVPYSLPTMAITPTPEDPFIAFTDELKKTSAYLGWSETISFPFHSEKTFKSLRLNTNHPYYPNLALINPLSEEDKFLQTTLLPSLITAICHGQNHGQKNARLFEIGRCYYSAIDGKNNAPAKSDYFRSLGINGRYVYEHVQHPNPSERPIEKLLWAGIVDQPLRDKTWRNPELAADFYTLKNHLFTAFKFLDIYQLKLHTIESQHFPFLNPRISASVFSGDICLGYFGELHPELSYNFDFKNRELPLVFEFNVEQIFKAKAGDRRQINATIPRFPAITRDFALLVDNEHTHAAVEEMIGTFNSRHNLSEWHLFDLYCGKGLPEGKKSMAYRFIFQHPEKTLKDSEVDNECELLLEYLKKHAGLTLRQ